VITPSSLAPLGHHYRFDAQLSDADDGLDLFDRDPVDADRAPPVPAIHPTPHHGVKGGKSHRAGFACSKLR
jgi:hypothetical protein